MKNILIFTAMILLFTHPACADKGPIIWQENVSLIQESQKAIIMHNGAEEALILGTEMKATRDIEVLEFIPFPSEPSVERAGGDPFKTILRLVTQKGLVFFRSGDLPAKGGRNGEGAAVPVEILVSQKIGLHDVTVIKINDVNEFRNWCENFFRNKGVEAGNERLSRVYDTARDYTQRGYTYFVFDRVNVSGKVKFVEPLSYRFKSRTVYYPLKTSNLIGGAGSVELIFLLPGSIMNDVWQDADKIFDRVKRPVIELSSSSKIYRRELGPIGFSAGFFSPASKVYMQVLRYKGAYAFKDDLTYDIGKLKPHAYRFESTRWRGEKEFTPEFTRDEVRDLREFFCPKSGDPGYMFAIIDHNLDCWSFIPNDEYEIYSVVFKDAPSGVPRRNVVLEKMTARKELKGRKLKLDQALVKDFNDKNKLSLPLENGFPDDGGPGILLADDKGKRESALAGSGKTHVSRVGFNRDRSVALVHVDHIAGPRSGVAYYITLHKKDGAWAIADSIMEAVY